MPKRIVAIVGDFYHKEEWAVASLNKALELLPDVTVEYETAENIIDHLQSKPDAFILFKENRLTPQEDETNIWMDAEVEEAICDYVRAGGGWLAWHSGLASYDSMEAYTSMLRGYFEYHPAEHQMVTYTPVSGTELADQQEPFAILDEHYFVHCDEKNTNVFLTSKSVDGSSIAGWTHTFGQGTVVCYTPAHLEEGLLHPMATGQLADFVKRVTGYVV